MKCISKIGPMCLLKVKYIVERDLPYNSITYYVLGFDGCKLAVTALHAFVVVSNGDQCFKNANQLKSGDKIWVDVSAFQSDGSFTHD